MFIFDHKIRSHTTEIVYKSIITFKFIGPTYLYYNYSIGALEIALGEWWSM